MSAKPDLLKLSCVVQTYAWGKVGLDSEVARLKKSGEEGDFVVDERQTYAEVEKNPRSRSQFCERSKCC